MERRSRSVRRIRIAAGAAALTVGALLTGMATDIIPSSYCQPVREFGNYIPKDCSEIKQIPVYTRPTVKPSNLPGGSHR